MALEGEDCFDNQYYLYIRRLFIRVGLWPYTQASKRLPRVYLISVMMFLGVTAQVYLMLVAERKVDPIIQLLQTFIPSFAIASAYWNLQYNSELVKEIIEFIRNSWSEISLEDELNILQTYAAESKLYSQGMACKGAFFLYIAFLIFPSVFSIFLYIFGAIQQNKLILPVYYDAFTTTQSLYTIMFLYEVAVIIVIYFVGTAHYSLFIAVLQHACALFVIVTNKIDRPFLKNEYKFYWAQSNSERETEFEWMVTIIQNYNTAIKFFKLIRLLYEKLLIIETLMGITVFVVDFIYFLRLLDSMITSGEMVKIFMFINSSLFLLYCYNYLGQKIIEHSIGVCLRCRMIPFYALSVRTNKLLLQLIIQSTKPCCITVAGVLTASHELFAKALQSSFSFATVCYNVH